jgi:hypothetical protein
VGVGRRCVRVVVVLLVIYDGAQLSSLREGFSSSETRCYKPSMNGRQPHIVKSNIAAW